MVGAGNIIKLVEELSDLVGRAEVIMENMEVYLPDSSGARRIRKSYNRWLEKLNEMSERGNKT